MKWDRIEEPKPPKSRIDDRWTWRPSDPAPAPESHAPSDQDGAAPSPDEDLRHSPLTPPPA
jgi:hypothetical protein